MFLPYNVDVPMERWPIANWVLIGFTTLVSFAVWAHPTPKPDFDPSVLDNPTFENLKALRDRLNEDPDVTPLSLMRHHIKPWSPFSYALVHADVFHLAGNMFFLFVFGNAINAKLGHVSFLIWYFLLGAIAGCAWLAFGSGMALVGASGAIMGLTGMFLVFYPRNDVSVFYWFSFYWTGVFAISSFWVVLFYMAFDLFGTLAKHGDGVAYICHLAGALVGITSAIALVTIGLAEPAVGEENLLQVLGLAPPTERDGKFGRKKRKLAPLPVASAKRKRETPPPEADAEC
jgi:membrane associated rhomboid family serine protease